MKYFLTFLGALFYFFLVNSVNAYYSCSEYGTMAYSTGGGYCQCLSGYEMGTVLGRSYCVPEKTCTDLFGFGAKDNYDGTCSCRFGYKFENTYSGKECKIQYCGLYSTFNDATKECECNVGYTQDARYSTFACREKAYSTYAYIDNIDNSLISLLYNDPYGMIQGKDISVSACIGLSPNLIGQKGVVNLLYDKMLNNGDYFMLPPDYETSCYISSVSNTPEKLTCPDMVNGYLAVDNKCYCNSGYSFDISLNFCRKNVTTALKCKKGELKRKGICLPRSSSR